MRNTKLKKILFKKNITQQDLSRMSGIMEYKISKLCTNKNTNLMRSNMERICKVLNCSLDEAFGDNNKVEKIQNKNG